MPQVFPPFREFLLMLIMLSSTLPSSGKSEMLRHHPFLELLTEHQVEYFSLERLFLQDVSPSSSIETYCCFLKGAVGNGVVVLGSREAKHDGNARVAMAAHPVLHRASGKFLPRDQRAATAISLDLCCFGLQQLQTPSCNSYYIPTAQ